MMMTPSQAKKNKNLCREQEQDEDQPKAGDNSGTSIFLAIKPIYKLVKNPIFIACYITHYHVRIWVLRVNDPVRYSSTSSRHATVLL
jgi:hypothetical protein